MELWGMCEGLHGNTHRWNCGICVKGFMATHTDGKNCSHPTTGPVVKSR